jgi:hypothetical protein
MGFAGQIETGGMPVRRGAKERVVLICYTSASIAPAARAGRSVRNQFLSLSFQENSLKNGLQTSSFAHLQMQKMFKVRPGLSAAGFRLLAHPAVPGDLQMRRSDAPCDRTKGRGPVVHRVRRRELVAPSLNAEPAVRVSADAGRRTRLYGDGHCQDSRN